MPRAKKTMGGSPAQKIDATPNQTYGNAKVQEALQKSMPAPQVNQQLVAPRSQPAPSQAGAPVPGTRPQANLSDVMEQIRGQGGLLYAPDDRPQLPVTDGLSTGPGRGTEALQPGSSLGRTLQTLASRTGDSFFLELATKANLR